MTGPVNFECPHPDAHHPVANSFQDANGEPWEDEESTPEPPHLDPHPWASTESGARYRDRQYWTFLYPRPDFEQDRAAYGVTE